MGNRCPDCAKFVGLEEPEEASIEDSGCEGGHVTVEVHMTRNCAECGTEMKESYLTYEKEFECPSCSPDVEDIELISVEAEVTSRMQSIDRNGKPIKNPRYMKTYYGADLTLSLKCNHCEHEWTEDDGVEAAASEFEDVC